MLQLCLKYRGLWDENKYEQGAWKGTNEENVVNFEYYIYVYIDRSYNIEIQLLILKVWIVCNMNVSTQVTYAYICYS